MAPPELSHIVKFNRAKHHIENLDHEIRIWINAKHYTSTFKPDPDIPGNTLVIASAEPIPVEPISGIIGDAVQNLRNALDHTIFSLSKAYAGANFTQEKQESSQFPIIGDISSRGVRGMGEQMFKSCLAKAIGSVNPKARDVIEACQPYHRGRDFTTHPLWVLRELSNADKHRVLLGACGVSRGLNMGLAPGGKPQLITFKKGPIRAAACIVETDTVIASLPLSPGSPDFAKHMNIGPSLQVCFLDGILATRDILTELRSIQDYIEHRVIRDLNTFL